MRLIRSTAVVSMMTMLSRVLGFLRDVVFARVFGAGATFDAFVVALRIPNMLRRFFAEGSFSLAFVPVLAQYREKQDAASLKALIDAAAGTLGAVVALVVGLGMLLVPGLVLVFAPGFADDPATRELTGQLLRITFPYALLISLTAFCGSILNAHQRFALPAVTPVLLNVCLIAAALWGAQWFAQPVVALAWGVLIAGVLQLLIQLPALAGLRLLPKPTVVWRHPGVVRIRQLMLPTLFGSSVAQINILIDTLMASLVAAGAVSWLYYSDRLMEFPLGVFGVAISTVMLPTLSRRFVSDELAAFNQTVDWGMKMAVLIALPAAAGLALLAVPITSTLYFHGQFSLEATQMSAASLAAYAAGLPAFIMVKVLAPAYYARQDTKTPVKIAVLAMVTNIVLNIAFVVVLTRWSLGIPPHAGIALASSLAGYLNAAMLYRGLQAVREQSPAATGWKRHTVAVLVAVLSMGIAVLWLAGEGPWWLAADTLDRIGRLALTIGSGAAIYLLLVTVLGVSFRQLLAARH